MGLAYACNTPLTFLYKYYTHQYINTCHGGVTLEAVLTVCFPAKADIQYETSTALITLGSVVQVHT